MLKRKTVLVLGAGASQPFRFPIGVELSQRLVEQLRIGHQAYDALKKFCTFLDDEINDFRDAFQFSGKNSVDSFLEHRTEYLHIGKAATAALLINYERSDNLFVYQDNWLRYLYNNLNTSFDEFGSNQLAIVTFNYDRTVEHFLFTSLKNTYGKSDEECRQALEHIPIIHLHGRLGDLPWQNKIGRAYEAEIDRDRLKICIEGIKIIHEDISDGRDKDFQLAIELMEKAEQILFLGFGYNLTNIQRLAIADIAANKAVGTIVGLGAQERHRITIACGGKIRFADGDCLHFVREELRWD